MNIVGIHVGHHCSQRIAKAMKVPAGDTAVVSDFKLGNQIICIDHLCCPGLDPWDSTARQERFKMPEEL